MPLTHCVQSMPTETATPEKKEQFKTGLQQLAKATAEDSGLWQVVCCASEQHIMNAKTLESMRKVIIVIPDLYACRKMRRL